MQLTFTKTQIASAIAILFLLFIGFIYIAVHQSPAEAKAEEMVANKEAWAALEQTKGLKEEQIAALAEEVAQIESEQDGSLISSRRSKPTLANHFLNGSALGLGTDCISRKIPSIFAQFIRCFPPGVSTSRGVAICHHPSLNPSSLRLISYSKSQN